MCRKIIPCIILVFWPLITCPTFVKADTQTLPTDIQALVEEVSKMQAKGEFKTKLEAIKHLAEKGKKEAQWVLGGAYQTGKGVPKDYKMAVFWFLRAADQGYPLAQVSLGHSYQLGEGVSQDKEEAARWYKLAAEEGFSIAQFNLGEMYETGEGILQDYQKSFQWYQLAAEQGLPIAQYKIGAAYAGGKGVDQDYQEAIYWYRLAAEQGYLEAQWDLGVMYETGDGVARNQNEAVHWYRLAAKQGHTSSQKRLALLEQGGKDGLRVGNKETPTAQEIAKKAFRSTVLLVMEDANGQPLSLGSGFFVNDGAIATNLHVIANAERGYAKLVGQKTKYDVNGITAIDYERDLVLLKVTIQPSQHLPLGNSDLVEIGETVYAIGNPKGLEGTFSQGIVSSIREMGSDKILQITAPISPGSSGGPIINRYGEVVGVSVATYKGGQNLNFAIPSNALKRLIANAGPVKSLAYMKPAKALRSIVGELGGRSSDGVVGFGFHWNLPGNQFSGEYSFSFRNQLRDAVRKVYCLIVFKDSMGNPIDIDVIQYDGVIPAGLAKRVKGGVDGSIGVLSKWLPSAVEIRILDFEIVN